MACCGVAAADARRDSARADSLYHRALTRWAQARLESRRTALADLEEAALLAPKRGDVWLALGNRSIEAGRFGRGRSCLARAAKLAPNDCDAWLLLGAAWKHDWLSSLDRSSLDEAMKCFGKASAAAPERAEGWSARAALALLRGRAEEACASALRAHRVAPGEAEPVRLLGSAFFRLGQLALSDSAFRVAEDLAGEPPTDGEPSREWHVADPDFTTAENEAQLDYLTRLTLARFLFRDHGRVHWDERAELFVRYGPPAAIEYNSAGAQLGSNELEYRYPRHSFVRYAPDPIPFAFNAQVWRYPDLGIEVTLWDRSLSQSYELPYSNEAGMDPRPDPALVAARPDLAPFDGGRSVFRAMPPGDRAMAIEGDILRFPYEGRVHVLGHLFADGAPADSLWGAWAVVSADGRLVRREAHALSPSACDPTTRQVADFAADLPPGDYRLDLSARASQGRHGIAHLNVHVDGPPDHLVMSDLALLCGEPGAYVGPEGVRLEPDVDHVVNGATLTAYYELDRLALGAGGTARFAYTYSIHAMRHDRQQRRPAVIEATREEENAGPHRRQFVSVPIRSVTPGDYELRIEVRDLNSGATTTGSLRFSRGKAPKSLGQM